MAGKLADQTAKNDDISVELLNLISEKKQVQHCILIPNNQTANHLSRAQSRPLLQVELKLSAAQSELDAAKLEVASRDETSAESKSQAEAAAARLQVLTPPTRLFHTPM